MTLISSSPSDPTQLGRYRIIGSTDPQANFRLLLAAAPDGSIRVVEQSLPRLLESPELRPRFRHGAVAAMRVSGPGNATVLDVDADNELPWLARSFVPSVRLDRAVAEYGPLPVDAVRALAAALARALQGVHAAGLVHQRLRPDTIAMTSDGVEVAGIDVLAGASDVQVPPDYLSPEQSAHGALAASSDVFALGSVLAFAASGKPPFAEPSVAKTLFAITHRDPDLSAVPEPLRELIAACLRRDPADRPSPAQIIAYVGTEHAAWPTEIQAKIEGAERAVSALLAAAPPVPLVDVAPGASAFAKTIRFGRSRLAASGRWVKRSPARTRAALALAAIVALVASGALWLPVDHEAVAAKPPTISVAELRLVDSCAWLRSAMGDSVNWREGPSRTDKWRFKVDKSWHCDADADERVYDDRITLKLGVDLREVPHNRKLIDGVLVYVGNPKSCERAIPASDDGGRLGVLLKFDTTLAEKQGCAVADDVVAGLARTLRSAPQKQDAAISLSSIDPCALLDRAEVIAAVPRLTEAPTYPEARNGCTWYGSAEVSVTMIRTDFMTTGSVTVDGISLLTGTEPTGPRLGCSRIYRHRTVDEKKYEAIEITIAGPHVDGNTVCRTVESLMVKAVRQLPKP
ncbi:protein kinase domain-containing protein [Nocardia camponoti]|uniref:Protein kinase domain-containing protein n=1 Tax=Nocardia camponoti TaxID=1616106 RepID=A0A917VD44_9NOCA|nr:protein kinase [Nocardia camponoti]GGK64556.1 hypothetical protein GCM10011591_40960 [Nocardia camponoti]